MAGHPTATRLRLSGNNCKAEGSSQTYRPLRMGHVQPGPINHDAFLASPVHLGPGGAGQYGADTGMEGVAVTKAEIQALEKIFALEIDGRLPLQSKAKIYHRLEAMGCVRKGTRCYGKDRFGPITAVGWFLTHRGRYQYCLSCDEASEVD